MQMIEHTGSAYTKNIHAGYGTLQIMNIVNRSVATASVSASDNSRMNIW